MVRRIRNRIRRNLGRLRRLRGIVNIADLSAIRGESEEKKNVQVKSTVFRWTG